MTPATGGRRPYKLTVRIISVICALSVMAIYSLSTSKSQNRVDLVHNSSPRQNLAIDEAADAPAPGPRLTGRRLFQYSALTNSRFDGASDHYILGDSNDDGDDNGSGDGNQDNCTAPRGHHEGYNDSCSFVLDQCSGNWVLFDYLRFILCDMKHVQWLGYIILALWLLYLISLLATTADNFFIPPLNLLSQKLHLSPSIAGITLLAIGNGAPDVFTAYASLSQGHIELVLGALIGASIFISTVVLGTIIIIVNVRSEHIDKIDFIRDVVAYMCAVALVIGVAYDGDVRIWEAISFLLFYIIYIIIVVVIGYIRKFVSAIRANGKSYPSETDPLVVNTDKEKAAEENKDQSTRIKEELDDKKGGKDKQRLVLLGLTYPRGANIGVKFQWLVEWPISLLRWLSIPPCCYFRLLCCSRLQGKNAKLQVYSCYIVSSTVGVSDILGGVVDANGLLLLRVGVGLLTVGGGPSG